MNNTQDPAQTIRTPILWLGVSLIVLGAGALIFLASAVVQIIEDPTQVELVTWLISSTEKTGLLINGDLDGKTFEIRASDALQYLFLGIIGLMMVSVLVSVVSSLISSGIKLVMFTRQSSLPDRDNHLSNKVNHDPRVSR